MKSYSHRSGSLSDIALSIDGHIRRKTMGQGTATETCTTRKRINNLHLDRRGTR